MLSRARTLPLAAFLLLAALLPTGVAWAAPAETADGQQCAMLPPAAFGSAQEAVPVPVLAPGTSACFT
ncbi:hypothetical protein, partial [Streptomyces sp. NPDC058084]|uniref:hypothetical protein n=1 Tax=Streptomyces sp. NPDC058084 TaxID=3346333 RepID=UPI0036E9DAF8